MAGEPIIVNTCYCDDCQGRGPTARRIRQFGAGGDADGGTEFMVFRRDRIACTRGADRLQAMRLTPGANLDRATSAMRYVSWIFLGHRLRSARLDYLTH